MYVGIKQIHQKMVDVSNEWSIEMDDRMDDKCDWLIDWINVRTNE